MGALSGFVVRGPAQAALVAAVALTLSVAFPPIVWLSNAAVALYVMRFGWQRSVPMLLVSVVGSAVLFWAAFGHPVMGLMSAVVFWLPLVLCASVLRKTVSLELASLTSVGLALLLVILCYLWWDDPAVFWGEMLASNELLAELLAQNVQQTGVDVLSLFATLATGMLAAGVVLNTLVGLFLGRHWQAQQYQPGGFGESFNRFKLGKTVVAGALGLCALGLASGSGFGFAVAMPLFFLLAVQGLAVVHGIAAAKRWPKAVLVLVYLALLVPHAVALICVLAAVDAWFDLRARAQGA